MIMFLYFTDTSDLKEQLAEVWSPITDLETLDEQWNKVVSSTMEDIRASHSTSAVVTEQ